MHLYEQALAISRGEQSAYTINTFMIWQVMLTVQWDSNLQEETTATTTQQLELTLNKILIIQEFPRNILKLNRFPYTSINLCLG
jgi:hypothetical protein